MIKTSKAKTLFLLSKKNFPIPHLKIFKVVDYKNDYIRVINFIKNNFKDKIAIRSSNFDEDNKKSSLAGKYKSYLNIDSQNIFSIKESIDSVIESYNDVNSRSEFFVQEIVKNVIVSGVCTTIDIHNYIPVMKIEYTYGNDTTIVTSGSSKLNSVYYFENKKYKPEIKFISKLINIVKKLEIIFKSNKLDIEFVVTKSNKIKILQVREIILPKKITIFDKYKISLIFKRLSKKINKLSEKHYDLYGDKSFYGVMPDWNPGEIIGTKPKPLALSLYQELITNHIWSANRSRYGFRDLSSYHLITVFFGTPYIDVRVDFNSWIPVSLDTSISKKLTNYYLNEFKFNKKMHDKIEFEILFTCFTFSTLKKLNKKLLPKKFSKHEIKKISDSLVNINNKIFSEYENEKKNINKLIYRQKLVEDSKMYIFDKIYCLIEDCKKYGTLPFAGLARCGFIAIEMLNSMVEENVISELDKDNFLSSIVSISSNITKDFEILNKIEFIKKYGHLRPNTYEISSLNYKDGYNKYFIKKNKNKNFQKIEKKKFQFNQAQKKKISIFLKKNKLKISCNNFLYFIKDAIFQREYSKFIFTKSLDLIFSNIKKIGKKFEIKNNNDLSYLKIDEITDKYYNLNNISISNYFKLRIKNNKLEYNQNNAIKLPPTIFSPKDIYYYENNEEVGNFVTKKNVSGQLFFLNKNFNLKDCTNKIVCIENADPGYDFLFTHNIKGLVTKFGGQNSHMAIRAAELLIPSCIGYGDKNFENLKNKKFITLDCKNRKIF